MGDAVLDWLLCRHFYQNYTSCGPSMLTDLKQCVVSNESFGRISIQIGNLPPFQFNCDRRRTPQLFISRQ